MNLHARTVEFVFQRERAFHFRERIGNIRRALREHRFQRYANVHCHSSQTARAFTQHDARDLSHIAAHLIRAANRRARHARRVGNRVKQGTLAHADAHFLDEVLDDVFCFARCRARQQFTQPFVFAFARPRSRVLGNRFVCAVNL